MPTAVHELITQLEAKVEELRPAVEEYISTKRALDALRAAEQAPEAGTSLEEQLMQLATASPSGTASGGGGRTRRSRTLQGSASPRSSSLGEQMRRPRRGRGSQTSEQRREQMLALMRDEPDIEPKAIAERIGIPTNTLYRMIGVLRDHGNLDGGGSKGPWVIDDDRPLPPYVIPPRKKK